MELKPFVAWAGGKRQLLKHLLPLVPEYHTYHEPFVGGGALLFALQPRTAIINDSNKELINCYKQIRDNCEDLCFLIQEYESCENTEENYNGMRVMFNSKISNGLYDADTAGLMLVLNKRCFNGLYRVNSQGLFNSPWGKNIRIPSKVDLDNLRNISAYLNNNKVRIFDTDYNNVLKLVKSDDFMFFDSPYVPLSKTADFDRYTKNKFNTNEHIALANAFKKLDNEKVKMILTNHDTSLTRELYSGYNIKEIAVQRSINADTSKRFGKEIIITNF